VATLRRTPLYIETAQQLRRMIRDGDFRGSLPSQDQLCERFGVSRATVREAIRVLEQGGLLTSRQGAGTVINHGPVDAGLEELLSTSELIGSGGFAPGTSFVDVRRTVASSGSYPVFAGRPVFLVDRVRTADGVPFVSSLDVVADSGYDEDELRSATGEGSLLAWLEQHGVRVEYAKTAISATAAERTLAERLDVAQGTPLVFTEEIGYGRDDLPLYYSQDFYRCDLTQFHVVRRRLLA
jgi:GntR family transcriptional regulator